MLVIIDEAYMDFGDMSVMDAVNEFDNLIVLRTCSKAVGIAAVRLGFAVSNRRIAKALTAAKSPYNVNSITQQIGATVLQNKQYLKDCIAQIIESRNELYKEICAIAENSSKIIKVYKPETNFVFVKLDGAEQVHKALLEKGIAVRCFKDYLRISAGSKSENSALIKALKEIL